jgi:hypothetical protein
MQANVEEFMEMEYIGEMLPDGHLSVDSAIIEKLTSGQKLKIKIEPIPDQESSIGGLSKEARDFLDFMQRTVHRGGYRQGKITRDFIHDDGI